MSNPRDELRTAWDQMINSLEEARGAIDQPELMPPPLAERNLAEGYRYLMGFVHSAVERAMHSDPLRPKFRNALSVITRGTIDNADAIYFYAPIDGQRSYLLRASGSDTSAWSGGQGSEDSPLAPHYVIFEASSGGLAGDSGSLMELRPGVKTQTGVLDSSAIQVNADGSFEVLLAPQKPEDYHGNFIATLKRVKYPHPDDPDAGPDRYANYISGRQLFNDWEREQALHFELYCIGEEGKSAPAYRAEQAALELRALGEIVRNQMHFWNAFWTVLMGTYGEREGSIPGVAFPRNAFNRVNAASGATGGGMSTNLYAGGVFELAEDEALILENRVAVLPEYFGFQLANLWGESLEYANRTGSLNRHQLVADADGIWRVVIAHRDPGVPNWLDTSGLEEGFMTARWAYSHTPEQAEWPDISARKVKIVDLPELLPEGTPAIAPEQRRQQIAVRQKHVQRRFRSF
ncbi:MAG: hypothetical protein AAGA91_05965 [Pseudomonadota bacterium]